MKETLDTMFSFASKSAKRIGERDAAFLIWDEFDKMCDLLREGATETDRVLIAKYQDAAKSRSNPVEYVRGMA